ncbi:unnamed protein product [Polarella glacialis]|uniref:Uncharacterized protein n=1 Tax=Polarella glacialis TaxID=89957 RepID=A0A813FB36_POLGL|nr:unnamed protein product [Polarella glacialis]
MASQKCLAALLLGAATLLFGAAEAGATLTSNAPVMVDVLAAYNAIPDDDGGVQLGINTGPKFPKGYNKGHLPYSEHIQGIQRAQGTNVLLMAGSGTTEHSGHLFAAQLEPSSAQGSSLGSAAGASSPPASNVIVDVERVDIEYDHCGGLSTQGPYLVVGCEAGCKPIMRVMGKCHEVSRVHFYDVSNPLLPKKLPYVIPREGATAGASGLLQEADGRYLLIVGRTDSAILDFYRSNSTSLLSDPGFKPLGTWYKASLTAAEGQKPFFGDYQNLNLVRQTDGKVFLFGVYRSFKGLGSDYVDLFELNTDGEISIHQLGSKRLNCWVCWFLPIQVVLIGFIMCLMAIKSFLTLRAISHSLAWPRFLYTQMDGKGDLSDLELDHAVLSSSDDTSGDNACGSSMHSEDSCCLRLLSKLIPVFILLVPTICLMVAAWFAVRGVNFTAGAGVYFDSPEKLFVYGTDWEPTNGAQASTCAAQRAPEGSRDELGLGDGKNYSQRIWEHCGRNSPKTRMYGMQASVSLRCVYPRASRSLAGSSSQWPSDDEFQSGGSSGHARIEKKSQSKQGSYGSSGSGSTISSGNSNGDSSSDYFCEVCCSPHSRLSNTVREGGREACRLTLETGFDFLRRGAVRNTTRLARLKKPIRCWVSVPCKAFSPFQNMRRKSAISAAKLEQERAQRARSSNGNIKARFRRHAIALMSVLSAAVFLAGGQKRTLGHKAHAAAASTTVLIDAATKLNALREAFLPQGVFFQSLAECQELCQRVGVAGSWGGTDLKLGLRPPTVELASWVRSEQVLMNAMTTCPQAALRVLLLYLRAAFEDQSGADTAEAGRAHLRYVFIKKWLLEAVFPVEEEKEVLKGWELEDEEQQVLQTMWQTKLAPLAPGPGERSRWIRHEEGGRFLHRLPGSFEHGGRA